MSNLTLNKLIIILFYQQVFYKYIINFQIYIRYYYEKDKTQKFAYIFKIKSHNIYFFIYQIFSATFLHLNKCLLLYLLTLYSLRIIIFARYRKYASSFLHHDIKIYEHFDLKHFYCYNFSIFEIPVCYQSSKTQLCGEKGFVSS